MGNKKNGDEDFELDHEVDCAEEDFEEPEEPIKKGMKRSKPVRLRSSMPDTDIDLPVPGPGVKKPR